MQMKSDVLVHAVKESKGEFQGTAFSSTTFHCEVDMKENGAGRSIGRVTRPFKCGPAEDFDKWLQFANELPMQAEAVFDMEAIREVPGTSGGGVKLTLVSIRPMGRA